MDLRVQKTYKALFHSFQDLLQEKPFEEITVKELCGRAMIRTATFYKHFTDKYDFCAFMIRELRRKFYEKTETDADSPVEEYCLSLIRNGLDFIVQHQQLFQAAESDSMLNVILDTTANCMEDDLLSRLRSYQQNGGSLPASVEMTADLMIGALTRVIRRWLKSRQSVTADQLTEELRPFLHRMLNG